MRIIGEIAHSAYKITAMKNEGRLLLKIENGLLEQTFKFRATEELNNMSQIALLCSADLLKTAAQCFELMQDAQQLTLKNYLQSQTKEVNLGFPEII